MAERFLIYGMTGWSLEIFWTAIINFLLKKDLKLIGFTSLWMFPVYGLFIFLEPVYTLISGWPVALRGVLYMLGIFAAEFATGALFKQLLGNCPWDYSPNKYNIKGLIRLDFAPLWYLVGILYEKLYLLILTLGI